MLSVYEDTTLVNISLQESMVGATVSPRQTIHDCLGLGKARNAQCRLGLEEMFLATVSYHRGETIEVSVVGFSFYISK